MAWSVFILLDGKPEPDLSECLKVRRPDWGKHKKPGDLDWPDLIAYPSSRSDSNRQLADVLATRLQTEGYRSRVSEYLDVPAW